MNKVIFERIKAKHPNQIGPSGYITQCQSCGDFIIVRLKIPSFCIDCQAIKCAENKSTFTRFYRSNQWRRIRILIFETKGKICVYCFKKATHIDHSIPIARGGTNHPDNLQPVCNVCNIKKHRSTDKEFRLKLGIDEKHS